MTSLLLALALTSGAALADGTALWLTGSPDPTLTPGLVASTPARLAPSAGWGEVDEAAVLHLSAEWTAVAPLKDELDGELQIMRRLEGALSAVDLVRAQDRDLVWRALVYQGYAVHRYFQDTLDTDPAAAPWRASVGGADPAVGPWLRAIALDPERVPTDADLPDEPQRQAYTELRARHLLQPAATVAVDGDATLLVDGRPAPARKVLLTPGVHHLALVVDGELALRQRVELQAGQVIALRPLAPASRLEALAPVLARARGPVLLEPAVLARLETAPAPVSLVVEVGGKARRFDLVGASAVPVAQERAPSAEEGSGTALVLAGGLGGGWIYDGNFVLQNEDAPETVGTVNAGAPVGTVSVGGELGAFAFGAGLDLALPVGAHHDLPVGDGRLRARPFPHLAVGHRLLQVAAGPLLPWHLGIGPRLTLPLPDLREGPVQLVAAYTHGIALPLTEQDGSTFQAGQARMAWVGVGGRWRSR